MSYLGVVFRRPGKAGKTHTNSNFESFMRDRGTPFIPKHARTRNVYAEGLKSTAKYDREQPQLDESAWALAITFLHHHFGPVFRRGKIKEVDDVLKEMNLHSSPGAPYNLKYQTKEDVLKKEPGIRAVLDDAWEAIGSAFCSYCPIWVSTQKDEVRTKEKVAAGNVRTFTQSPFCFTVLLNRLFLGQNEAFYDGHTTVPDWWSFVGLSKFFGAFDRLHSWLSCGGWLGWSLDETNYDASLFIRALHVVRDFRSECLISSLPVHAAALVRLRVERCYDFIINSIIVCGADAVSTSLVVQKTTGGPSGSGNTVVDNTLVLYLLFAYAFIIGCRERNIAPTYELLCENVRAILYGDDNTYTVSLEFNWFTPAFISKIWTDLGVVTKTPCEDPQPVEKLEFLSQNFAKVGDKFLPSPEMDKVLGSLHIGSKRGDLLWHYLRTCALLLDSWGNVQVRVLLNEYLNYLERKEFDLSNHKPVGGISPREILALRQSDSFYRSLYYGLEDCSELNRSAVFEAQSFYFSQALPIFSLFPDDEDEVTEIAREICGREGRSYSRTSLQERRQAETRRRIGVGGL